MIQGSGVLIQSLLAEGLIERAHDSHLPHLPARREAVRRHRRRKHSGWSPAKPSSTGVVIARYSRRERSDVSFAAAEPSEAEIARRIRWVQRLVDDRS